MTRVERGDRVEDRITKVSGIVWGITGYLHGCNRIHVMPEQLLDGKVQDCYVFDEPQLVVLKKRAYYTDNPDVEEDVELEFVQALPVKGKTGGPAYLKASKPEARSKK